MPEADDKDSPTGGDAKDSAPAPAKQAKGNAKKSAKKSVKKTVKKSAPAGKARKPQGATAKKRPSRPTKSSSGKAGATKRGKAAKPAKAAARTQRKSPVGPKGRVAKRSVLPGPKIKRAAKKAAKKATTKEKLASAERRRFKKGRRPLDGIRILDLSRLLPGPYASHILASFGAEVIKIERPGEGDYMREYLPKAQGMNAVFLTINRGKKSLAVDLKHPDGKEAFIALAKTADVVLDGFRPGVLDRLGLGYDQMSKLHPGIIYAALTGYGQTGPHANRAGHDLNYVALAGMLDLLGEANGMPAVPGVQLADIAAGSLPTVIGILLALQHRNQTGKGQSVDISIFDSLLGLMPVQVANYTATKRRPRRGHERLFGRYACYNVYPVRNGRYLTVAALEPKFWEELCEVLERPDLVDQQYVEGDAQQILMAELTRVFQKKEVSAWMELFEDKDVCVTEVREISRALQDEWLTERRMFTPVRGRKNSVYEQLGVFPRLSAAPGWVAGDAPTRGEHTRELLKSLKYTADRIEGMLASAAVEEPQAD